MGRADAQGRERPKLPREGWQRVELSKEANTSAATNFLPGG